MNIKHLKTILLIIVLFFSYGYTQQSTINNPGKVSVTPAKNENPKSVNNITVHVSCTDTVPLKIVYNGDCGESYTGWHMSWQELTTEPSADGNIFTIYCNSAGYENGYRVNYIISIPNQNGITGHHHIPAGAWMPSFSVSVPGFFVLDYAVEFYSWRNCYDPASMIASSTPKYCGATAGMWDLHAHPFTISIETGGAFASLYSKSTNQSHGNVFSGNYNEIGDLEVRWDSPYNGTADTFLVVKAETNGQTRRTEQIIVPSANHDNVSVNLESTVDTVYVDETLPMQARFYSFNCTFPVPPMEKIHLEIIHGQQYGNLVDLVTGFEGTTIDSLLLLDGTGSFEYKANGDSVADFDTIVFRASSSYTGDRYFYKTVYIKNAPFKIKVSAVPAVLAATDTATVVIQKQFPDGSIEEFSQYQEFEVGILTGCINGKLLVCDPRFNICEQKSYAKSMRPIRFIAADSIEGDSGEVLIRVGIQDRYNSKGSNSPGFAKRDSMLKVFYAQKRKVAGTPEKTEVFCSNSSFTSTLSADYILEVGGPSIELICPTAQNTMYITEEPNMPEIWCQARIKNYRPPGGNKTPEIIKFRWSFIVIAELKRDDGACQRYSASHFVGDSYAVGDQITYWKVPFIKDSAYFYFKSLWQKKCDFVTQNYTGGNVVFTGAKIKISIIAKEYSTGTEICRLALVISGLLLGKNPDLTAITEYLSPFAEKYELLTLAYKESGSYKDAEIPKQFNLPPNTGWPNYGSPNGWGMMKPDNPVAREQEVWNWKLNILLGLSTLNMKKDFFDNEYRNRHKSDNSLLTKKQKLINYFQSYNGGLKYRWVNNRWVPAKNLQHPFYGTDAYDIYIKLGGN